MSVQDNVWQVGRAGSVWQSLIEIRQAWLRIDQNTTAYTFASTRFGAIALVFAFSICLFLTGHFSLQLIALMALALLGCALVPSRRLEALSAVGIVYFLTRPFRTDAQKDFLFGLSEATPLLSELPFLVIYLPVAGTYLGICLLALWLHRRLAGSRWSRRPVLVQFLVLAGLTTIAMLLPQETVLHTFMWTLVTILSASFFFLSYAFVDQRAKDQTADTLRLGFMRPIWGASSIPMKGLHFLKRYEVKSPEELGQLRLRALKLIVWSAILSVFYWQADHYIHVVLGLPRLLDAIDLVANGPGIEITRAWLIVLINFLMNVIFLAAISHALIAIIRMAGYGIPRNVARPLSSRSIAEFWNRYFFYFKELLVDFFFYPAFIRFFKKSPKLRIAFATFAAAFVGNILFSVLSQMQLFHTGGLFGVIAHFENYIFYAAILSAGLIISQLRSAKPSPQDGFFRYDVLPRFQVLGFFALLQIFSDEGGRFGVAERLEFLGHLFLV